MSGPEIAHRAVELSKRLSDARRNFGWDRFSGLEGPLDGLPGLVPVAGAGVHQEVAGIDAGNFCLLGQQWRLPAGDRPWYAQRGIWHRDPVSGDLWPGAGTFSFQIPYRHERRRGDVKFVWELNRLQILQVLAAAGAHGSVPDIMESWMQANPPFEGINWTSGLEAASRVASLLVVLASVDTKLRRRLDPLARRFLSAHVYWIARYPSLHSSANNHRVAELAALLLAGTCAPGLPGARRYLAESQRDLEQAMLDLFYPDGVGAEQSPTYAAYSLEWFALASLAAEERGTPFSPTFRSRLHAAASHLRWMMDDGGRLPRIGDDDEGRVLASRLHREDRYVASVVALLARMLSDPALQPPSSDPHLRDRLMPRRANASAAVKPECALADDLGASTTRIKVFGQGGYTVARTGTPHGSLVAVFDHGPLGFGPIAAHGHADALAIWLHWGDEPILVDAGTYLYHSGGADRDLFRGTVAHNTLEVEGADQSVIAGPFNWSSHARTLVIERTASGLIGEHDGYFHRFGVIHRRGLVFERNMLVIEDRLIGRPSKRPLRWSIGFRLAPHVVIRLNGDRADIRTKSGRVLSFCLGSSHLGWARMPAMHSPAFNCRDEALDQLRVGATFNSAPHEQPYVRTVITACCVAPEGSETTYHENARGAAAQGTWI
ncbi:heparinase II/III family protein [Bradyrhizobium sp. McL0616]|uniref:heparinase II/III family protein n=1 Tax=Bradyrhizobium sp. McL0616 TaxID=3415674 RepID=UPI003CEED731